MQSAQATVLLERELSQQRPGFVSLVVMVEIAWVLERTFRLSHVMIAAAIERRLQADRLVVEAEQAVFTAMCRVRERRGSFADALIGALDERPGCTCTATFDQRALRLPGFAPVPQLLA